MGKDVLHSYYIGEPAAPHKRGQDKNGYVQCLCWMLIYARGYGFAPKGCYTMAIGGGGIGNAKSVKEAKQFILKYAIDTLQHKQADAADRLKRITKALEALRGGGVAALEKTEGEYGKKQHVSE